MRIISKFRDYYDSVQRTGIDKSTIYMRNEIEGEVPTELLIGTWHGWSAAPHGVIGFCGKLYPYYWLSEPGFFGKGKFVYTLEESLACPIREKTYNWKELLQKLFDLANKKVEFLHPVFVLKHIHWSTRKPVFTWNAQLKEFSFEHIVDPYTAYQSIYQFLASLAAPEPKMVETSDEVRLEAHGFDAKFSFRKPKKKKK